MLDIVDTLANEKENYDIRPKIASNNYPRRYNTWRFVRYVAPAICLMAIHAIRGDTSDTMCDTGGELFDAPDIHKRNEVSTALRLKTAKE